MVGRLVSVDALVCTSWSVLYQGGYGYDCRLARTVLSLIAMPGDFYQFFTLLVAVWTVMANPLLQLLIRGKMGG